MSTVLRVLRGSTRNQSTADYSRQSLFVYGNRYYNNATIVNTEVADVTIEAGILVMRDAADTTRVKPIVATADLAKCIGIANASGEVVLAQNATTNIAFATKGDVDGEFLVLPEVSTLATLVGDRTLKDLLTSLGFVILNVTENSKFDN